MIMMMIIIIITLTTTTTTSNTMAIIIKPFQFQSHTFLIVAKNLPNRSAPYWSNPPFEFFDIQAFWRSVLSARVPKCQKIKKDGLDLYGPEHSEV